MSGLTPLCFICQKRPCLEFDSLGNGDGSRYRCEICGNYIVSMRFGQDSGISPEGISDDIRPLLSAAIRAANQKYAGAEPCMITPENYINLAGERKLSTFQKSERLLHLLAERSGSPGASTRLKTDVDYPLISAQNDGEMTAFIQFLAGKNFLAYKSVGDGSVECTLTIPAWESLEPVNRAGGKPGTCFVAMWFDPCMTEAYENGIIPAVMTDCGMSRPVRIDLKEHNNQITDEIMAGIRDAQFTIADFTGHRAVVYYEAGFARGLGRDVIYTCRKDAFEERHFDTSVINHVVWGEAADLRKKLANRIKATILPKA